MRYQYVYNSPINFKDLWGYSAATAVAQNGGALIGTLSIPALIEPTPFGEAAVGVVACGVAVVWTGALIYDAVNDNTRAKPVAIPDTKTKDKDQRIKTYVTYQKINSSNGSVYYGRASGYGSPELVLRNRDANHNVLNSQGYSPAFIDRFGYGEYGRRATRGREQQLIDRAGGIGTQGVGNKINGIHPNNPNCMSYHLSANSMYGSIAPPNCR